MGSERPESYRGKTLVVVDPTEYQKLSRGRGKRGRHMHHIERLRKSQAKARAKGKGRAAGRGSSRPQKATTTFGYVDVWAGLVLKGKQFLPLARQLFSSHHPKLKGQNRVEGAVLSQALGVIRRAGLGSIAVGDRGLGRKELVIRPANRGQDLVFITAEAPDTKDDASLAEPLARQPYLAEVMWDRGEEDQLRCRVRKVRATIRSVSRDVRTTTRRRRRASWSWSRCKRGWSPWFWSQRCQSRSWPMPKGSPGCMPSGDRWSRPSKRCTYGGRTASWFGPSTPLIGSLDRGPRLRLGGAGPTRRQVGQHPRPSYQTPQGSDRPWASPHRRQAGRSHQVGFQQTPSRLGLSMAAVIS